MASSSSQCRANSVRPTTNKDIKSAENTAIDLAINTRTDFLDCLKKYGLQYKVKSLDYRRVYQRYYRKVRAIEKYVMMSVGLTSPQR